MNKIIEIIVLGLLTFIFCISIWQVLKKYIYIKYTKFYVKYLKWSDIK